MTKVYGTADVESIKQVAAQIARELLQKGVLDASR